ncbi:hypothetical protein EC973_007620 [Apophysomyces ossiformis]|uniref:beta-N-acetylhexosaminidase n=1 Tax=Apophysomyces ossiformis TaxID=679940 RepID=A0A8H7EQA8_9FUNG|nr:hypothetical protein EC973_007620 [Apophysomyces ossiformis]
MASKYGMISSGAMGTNNCRDPSSNILIEIDIPAAPAELQDGLAKIMKHAPHKNIVSNSVMQDYSNECTWITSFIRDPDLRSGDLVVFTDYPTFKDVRMGDKFQIYVRYKRKVEAFRALGCLLSAARDMRALSDECGDLLNFSEQSQFDTQGVMIDCSRNGVLRLESIYFLLRNMALMGLNMLQLYTEDTYEDEKEIETRDPEKKESHVANRFFLSLGKYTRRELSLIDDYAFDLGIEVIPCIQTLGHLGQILQWPQYAHLRDNTEVLLAGSEATYEFIEKLIQAAAGSFRSNRIHLGMDEAYGVGEGRYRQLFGYKEPTEIFVNHLQRVNEICTRLGLQPMIWSDTSQNNTLQGYYDEKSNPATTGLVEGIPANIELVFWDYYHTSSDIYAQKLQQHRDLGCQQPWVACGAWTWSRFWTALPFTFESVRASTVAAKDRAYGVRNSFITIWGDEGNECDIYSSLPALCYYAQHGYTDQEEVDISLLKRAFGKVKISSVFCSWLLMFDFLFLAEGICGASFDDWIFASKIDDSPGGTPITPQTHFTPNLSKWLLWEDPFLSFLSPQYADEDLETHYGSIATHLFGIIENKTLGTLNERLELPARIASVLSLKCHLRQRLVEAYRNQQYERLYDLAQGRLSRLREEVDRLWRYHRDLWMRMYKPFGWEVLELRYGGLRSRLETMYDTIMAHVECRTSQKDQEMVQDREEEEEDEEVGEGNIHWTIPELETDLECIYYGSRTNMLLDHARVISPSRPG